MHACLNPCVLELMGKWMLQATAGFQTSTFCQNRRLHPAFRPSLAHVRQQRLTCLPLRASRPKIQRSLTLAVTVKSAELEAAEAAQEAAEASMEAAHKHWFSRPAKAEVASLKAARAKAAFAKAEAAFTETKAMVEAESDRKTKRWLASTGKKTAIRDTVPATVARRFPKAFDVSLASLHSRMAFQGNG